MRKLTWVDILVKKYATEEIIVNGRTKNEVQIELLTAEDETHESNSTNICLECHEFIFWIQQHVLFEICKFSLEN